MLNGFRELPVPHIVNRLKSMRVGLCTKSFWLIRGEGVLIDITNQWAAIKSKEIGCRESG